MNFLEQLVAEWYGYKGFFVRTNIKFGKNAHGKGGHVGEIDVLAYHPTLNEFIHTECSTDAWSWSKKQIVFKKKFENAEKYYKKILPFYREGMRFNKIVISGFSLPRGKMNTGIEGITGFLTIPEFINPIIEELSKKDPFSDAIPESYPLLRAIQYGTFYLRKKIKKEKN